MKIFPESFDPKLGIPKEYRISSPIMLEEKHYIYEGKESKILVLKGPHQTTEENDNHRVYSERLWTNLFNSEIYKFRLENHILLGMVGHPKDGKLIEEKASHYTRLLRLDGTTVYGESVVLPTPSGKILMIFHEHGVSLALSSRGWADSETKNAVEYLDEEGYDCRGFDVVFDPSVSFAWQDAQMENVLKTHNEDKIIVSPDGSPYDIDRKSVVRFRDAIDESLDFLDELFKCEGKRGCIRKGDRICVKMVLDDMTLESLNVPYSADRVDGIKDKFNWKRKDYIKGVDINANKTSKKEDIKDEDVTNDSSRKKSRESRSQSQKKTELNLDEKQIQELIRSEAILQGKVEVLEANANQHDGAMKVASDKAEKLESDLANRNREFAELTTQLEKAENDLKESNSKQESSIGVQSTKLKNVQKRLTAAEEIIEEFIDRTQQMVKENRETKRSLTEKSKRYNAAEDLLEAALNKIEKIKVETYLETVLSYEGEELDKISDVLGRCSTVEEVDSAIKQFKGESDDEDEDDDEGEDKKKKKKEDRTLPRKNKKGEEIEIDDIPKMDKFTECLVEKLDDGTKQQG